MTEKKWKERRKKIMKKTEKTIVGTIINKMKIESLVFDSLKHEDLTEEFINKFIKTMKGAYITNITALENLINSKDKNGGKNGE